MLARLQRLFASVVCALALAWATTLAKLGHPLWACAGAIVILFGYVLILGAEFVASYLVQRQEPVLCPSLRQLLQAWRGEIVAATRVFLWHQPFRSNVEPDHVPRAGVAARRGVVLVHGFVCNRGFWNPWIRILRAQNVPFIAVNLEPVFGSIDHYPRLIEAAVSRIEAATAMPAVLVGHSMGGLAIRAWLAEFSADARVHRVVTIACPHHGTWLARFGHTVNAKQMRQGNPWLARLAAREPKDRYARFTCFYGHCDNIVMPPAMGSLPGALNLHLPGTAHVHMAFQKVVFNEVQRWLA